MTAIKFIYLPFSLQDILVNKDFEDIFKQVKEQLPNIKMKHGGMEPPQKPKAKVHPMVKLMNYIEKNNLKLIDFFSQLDKDGSMCISYDEFEQGLEVNKIMARFGILTYSQTCLK